MKTKEALLKSSQQHKLMLKNELNTISNKTTHIARNVLIIGSIATGAYLLYKLLADDNEEEEIVKEKKSSESGDFFSGIGRVAKVLTHQALLFILSESKSKIQEYLNEIEKDGVNP